MAEAQGIPIAGIIAAGEGSRLRGAGPVKPLVEVSGRPLAHWVVRGLQAAGARRVVLLHNSSGGGVRGYLEKAFPELGWTFLCQDTASSWETFRIVSARLAEEAGRFLVSTVDAVVPPADARRFAAEAFSPAGGVEPEAALALTRFVDDEKPLWADLGPQGLVEALGEGARRRDAVTCGLYALSREAARRLPGAGGFSKLREFWTELARGGRVRGVLLGDTVDVDRPEDLKAAEKVTSCFES